MAPAGRKDLPHKADRQTATYEISTAIGAMTKDRVSVDRIMDKIDERGELTLWTGDDFEDFTKGILLAHIYARCTGTIFMGCDPPSEVK